MSYRPEVILDKGWVQNMLRFADSREADAFLKDFESRHNRVRYIRVVRCDDPVNARWLNGRLEAWSET